VDFFCISGVLSFSLIKTYLNVLKDKLTGIFIDLIMGKKELNKIFLIKNNFLNSFTSYQLEKLSKNLPFKTDVM